MNIFNEIDKLQTTIKAIRPLSKDQIIELKRYFNINLAYASNAMEGNTLTESETKAVIEDGITVGGKPLKYHLEATGHAQAYYFIYELAKKKELKEKDIKELHKLFYQQIEPDKAGKYRKIRVFISGSEYKLPNPNEVPGLMKRFVEKYKIQEPDKHIVEIATLIHKDFVFIHPFIDGNGRIARLLMNLILIKYGFPITIIPPVLRMEYINMLEKAHKNDKEYIHFIAERVKQAQLEYIKLLT
ncbi:MAG: Fic family protein [Bacteroidota bacterium]|nr:Fic family protein [Bacteroidota bacterium]